MERHPCPFSRFGSYFSLSIIDGGELGEGLYLHRHHGKSPRVFRIDPVRGGEVLAFETRATPSELVLSPAGGAIVNDASHGRSFCSLHLEFVI